MASQKSVPPKAKTILVVDDDPALLTLVVRTLSTRYHVISAVDGLAASELLGRPPIPDLLVCDVMMPKVDGFSLARLIRSKPELARLPIIFLTAKTAPAAVVEGIRLGAKHYIQKPFAIKELLEKVDKLLR